METNSTNSSWFKDFSSRTKSSYTRTLETLKHPNEDNKLTAKRTTKVLISEIIGTFILVAGILFPGAIGVNLAPDVHSWGSEGFWIFMNGLFGLILFKALWVAALILGLVLVLQRWSVNLNPAVTLSEMIAGNDSYKLGLTKIVVQFMSAIASAFFMAWVATATVNFEANEIGSFSEQFQVAYEAGYRLDATTPSFKHFNFNDLSFYSDNYSFTSGIFFNSYNNTGVSKVYTKVELTEVQDAWYWFICMGMEALLTFLLIISVFWGGKISKKWRPYVIAGVVWAILLVGIRFETIALNPARLMGPALAEYILTDGASKGLDFSWIYLIGELIAVVAFFGFTRRDLKRAVQLGDEKAIKALTGMKANALSLQGYSESPNIIEKIEAKNDKWNELQNENLFLKVENEHLKHGNKPFEQMTDKELFELTKKINKEEFDALSKEEKIILVKQDLSEKYIDMDLTREAQISKEILGLKVEDLEKTTINNIELTEEEKHEFDKLISDDVLNEKDLSKLTINQLKERLDAKNIGYKSNSTKKVLIQLLEENLIKEQNNHEN